MKILIVEDNKKLGENIKEGLAQEGYAVDIIADGLKAENFILTNRNEYDVILLDRMLPGKDGLSVCATLRENGIVVPVLMLTALDEVDDKVRGLNSGADDYLAKPFAFEELLARIHALLRRPQTVSQNILSASGIEIDTVGRTIKHKSKEINLTLKEFMVLEYLASHAGEVVDRDTLYSHAWDFADTSFSNTVDVHIKNLRKKLKDDGKIIQTIRGIGYKIGA